MSKAIDLLVNAAKLCGAEDNNIELQKIRKKAMEIDKENIYNSEDGLDATLNQHTINMRSRFWNTKNKDRNNNNIAWKVEPYFYWAERGIYRLLKNDEKEIFRNAVGNNLEIIYKDFYTMYQLKNEVDKFFNKLAED